LIGGSDLSTRDRDALSPAVGPSKKDASPGAGGCAFAVSRSVGYFFFKTTVSRLPGTSVPLTEVVKL
jgi:hypothetical protein